MKGSASSKLRFGPVTRGEGKVYVRVRPSAGAAGLDAASTWRSQAQAADGRALPSRIVVLETGEVVLVAPVLSLDYAVRVELLTCAGEALAAGVFTLRQGLCKLRSQLNTLRKSAEAEHIRNCDRAWRAHEARITDVRILEKNAEADILRFFVTQRMRNEEAPEHQVSVVDADGQCISEGKLVKIGEASYDSPDYPGVSHHRVAYSVEIPVGLGDFAIWAQDQSGSEASTIDCVWQGRADALRDDWRRLTLPAEFDPTYDEWFARHAATPRDLRLQRRAAPNFEIQPTFSLVVPLYHTPLGFLEEMAESVLAQTYGRFELILVNSTPEDAELAGAVSALCERDERVHVVSLERNLGISENTNAGIRAAAGDFVAFLDHDDVIEPDLLYWYVEGINRYPETDMLYCDEDKLEEGKHTFPFFKPDWDPIFLETNNYVCHLLCVRRSLLAELPLATPELDGAQDHHLALAAGERARNVYHARRVLYHWRIHEQSTAGRVDVKTESIDAGRLALERHFARIGLDASPEPVEGLPHCYRSRALVQGSPAVSLIVYGCSASEVEDAVARLTEAASWPAIEPVSVVAPDGDPGHVGDAVQEAAARAQGDYLLFVSAKARPQGQAWLEGLFSLAAREGMGVVAPKVALPDGSVKGLGILTSEFSVVCPICRDFPEGIVGPRGIPALAHQVTAVREDCLMVSRAAFSDVGGIPDGCRGKFWSVALCLALREGGYRNAIDPQVVVNAPIDAPDLSENVWETGLAWRNGECELLAHFPREYATSDSFYSSEFEPNGRFNLLQSPIDPKNESNITAVSRNEGTGFPEVELVVDHLIFDYEQRIMRGHLLIFDVAETESNRPLDFLAFDDGGQALCDSWKLMGDYVSQVEGCPDILMRRTDFSMRIPSETTACVVRACYAGAIASSVDEDLESAASSAPCELICATLDVSTMEALRIRWDERHVTAGLDSRYEEWFLARHRSGKRALGLQRDSQNRLSSQPLFSLIVPLWRTPLEYLRELTDSVIAQTYPNWELIFVDASPESANLTAELARLCEADARVRSIPLERNYGITENTNAGIRVAKGDFLVFCDHDDVIEPDALFWYAKAVSDDPATDLIYCDEDYLNAGHFQWPNFKGDWDIDLLCSMNYVCHMLCVRKAIVDALPELPGSEFDGAQDHNMTFLVGERARSVCHVPRILYHWRMHEGSTAGEEGVSQKSYALEAGRRAVQGHLDRMGISATARIGERAAKRAPFDRCYVDYRTPALEDQPLVSIVIPNHEAADILRICVESIYERSTWKNLEVVVVENGSQSSEIFALYDELRQKHANLRVVECEQPDGFNFSRLINCGVAASAGEYVLMLNNDTEVIAPDWLELMMGPMSDPMMGCVGAKLLYPDDTVQHVGVAVGRSHGPFHMELLKPSDDPCYYESSVLPHQTAAVTGACILVRKALYDAVGGLDESFPVDYNDVDFCLKVREAGFRVLMQPHALLHHYESVSRGLEGSARRWESLMGSLGRFHARWGRYLCLGDPYYSKNFLFNDPYHRLDW